MSEKHTPGEWFLASRNGSTMVYALDEIGDVNRFSALISGGYSYQSRSVKNRTSEQELAANARLMAAAPDLLAALLLAEEALSAKPSEKFGIKLNALSAVRRAITKTTPVIPTPETSA